MIVCENQSIIELKKTVAALQDIKNYLYVAILRRVLLQYDCRLTVVRTSCGWRSGC